MLQHSDSFLGNLTTLFQPLCVCVCVCVCVYIYSVEWWGDVKDEFERMWKEPVVAYYKVHL